ncbi:MAG TPA: hypothetical protein VGK67_16145 [Myxococcales bacterium]
MRAALAPVTAAIAGLLGVSSPAWGTNVVFEGELADRCLEWSKEYEARELERTEGLALPEDEAAAWAKARGAKVAELCKAISVYRRCGGACGKCPALASGAELNLPSGFLEGVGLSEADLLAWGKAESAGAEEVYVRSAPRERFLRNPAISKCSPEPDAIGSEGEWIWCRPSSRDDPNLQLKRMLVRGGAIGGSLVGLVGLTALLVVGRRSGRLAARTSRKT